MKKNIVLDVTNSNLEVLKVLNGYFSRGYYVLDILTAIGWKAYVLEKDETN